jgi:hypothetical protein
MEDSIETHEDRQVEFLRELDAEHAAIAGDIVHVGDGAWAIHGVIPVDGDVLMAEYATYDEARGVLDSFRTEPDLDDGGS